MEFTITRKVDFDIEWLASRMVESDDSFSEALIAEDMYDDYLDLNDDKQKDLKLAVFEEAVAMLKED